MTEVSRFFDRFSKTYDVSAFNQTLGTKYLSKIETDFIQTNLSIQNGDKVLDIGVGTGRNAGLLLDKGATVEGIDISTGMMTEAKNRLKGKNINFTVADAGKKIPFDNALFDYAVCMRVLKYIPTWKKTIKEVSRVLKKKGIFVLEIANLYSVGYLGLGNANYFLFNLNHVKNILKKYDFEIIDIEGGSRLPFPIYKNVDNTNILNIIKKIEQISDKILPETLFSRNIIIVSKKK